MVKRRAALVGESDVGLAPDCEELRQVGIDVTKAQLTLRITDFRPVP
jgi:hypothetical protein